MTVEALLSKLECVRETGSSRYLARCPAHDDKSPSLSVRALDDGRVLAHCFGGCDVADIVEAVGLSMSDLFPSRPLTRTFLPTTPLPLKAGDALVLLAHEAFVLVSVASELVAMMRRCELPGELGLDRMAKAVSRINLVRSYTESVTPPEIKAIRRGRPA